VQWQRTRSKQQRRAPRHKLGGIRVAGIREVAVTAAPVVKADRAAGMVVRAETQDRVDRAAVPEGHAAASGNIFARRRFASFASKRWT
jgi:hypothetical protein